MTHNGDVLMVDATAHRAIQKMLTEARAAALEEAAVVCETNADRWPGTSKVYAAMECADAIRALKGTPNVLE